MKDEQFEILVGLISEVKESLEGQISSKISSLREEINEKFAEMKKSQSEMEMRLSKAIYSVSEQLEEYERINRAQHGKMQDEMDKNSLRCEKERKKLEQGIDTLYTLYKDKEKLSKTYAN